MLLISRFREWDVLPHVDSNFNIDDLQSPDHKSSILKLLSISAATIVMQEWTFNCTKYQEVATHSEQPMHFQ